MYAINTTTSHNGITGTSMFLFYFVLCRLRTLLQPELTSIQKPILNVVFVVTPFRAYVFLLVYNSTKQKQKSDNVTYGELANVRYLQIVFYIYIKNYVFIPPVCGLVRKGNHNTSSFTVLIELVIQPQQTTKHFQ